MREMRSLLPHERVIYYADNAYCPYGLRSPEEIRERSRLVTGHLISRGAKAVVVACNTASAMAITHLRTCFPDTPIVGLEPAVKPAVSLTKSETVGVLATPRTVAGERLRWLIETHAGGVKVLTVAAAGLVELVEQGVLDGPEVTAALEPLLDPMIESGVDVVVLGCTHYPFLRDAIQAYMGNDVLVIDSGKAIAKRTEFVLEGAGLLDDRGIPGDVTFLTSARVSEVEAVATMLLGEPVDMRRAPVGDPVEVVAGGA